jgi:sugar phosphate isomerase/epimerase
MTLRFGIFARVFPRPSAARVAEAVRLAGYETVQLNLSSFGYPTLPGSDDGPDFAAARAAFTGAGVDIWSVSATFNTIDPDEHHRRVNTEAAVRLIGHAPQLGAGVVTLCSGTRDEANMWRAHPDNSSPAAWSDLRATLDQLLPAAAAVGVRLGIEPEPGNVITDAAVAAKLLAELGGDAEHVGIVLDPANLITPQTAPQQARILDEAFALLGGHVVGLHAKDVVADGEFAAAGLGALDYNHIAQLHSRLDHPVPVIVQDTTEADAVRVRAFLADAWSRADNHVRG